MKCVLLCSLSLAFLQICSTANIVAYMPLPFYSHQTAFKPLWLELARRGHKIILIQPNVIIENNENITHITLSETFNIMNKYKFFDKLAEGESIVTILANGTQMLSECLEYHVMHPAVQNLLKGGVKIDLMFVEHLVTFGYGIGSKLNVPTIGVVSMDANINAHIAAGNPTHPLLFPDKDMVISAKPTFKERITGAVFWLASQILDNYILTPLMENAVRKYLGDTKPLHEAVKNLSMLFINANPLFNVVRPLGPRTINIGGGVHLLKPRPLPKDLLDYLDKAENGVIYFSLGSSIASKQLDDNVRRVILKTFSELPYKILWKFDEPLPGISENVKIMNWLPQQDVLRHKNVKLFITQGGLQSMEEAIFSYVPMVALPFYGDQHSNTIKMVDRGFGVSLDHTKLDVATFKNAILDVINNPKYREKTKQLADLVMDQPMTGLEKAVWWTEYVLRHGQLEHFKNPLNDIPWYQYFFLDVIALFLVIALVTIYTSIKSLQVLLMLVSKLYKKGTTKRKIKRS